MGVEAAGDTRGRRLYAGEAGGAGGGRNARSAVSRATAGGPLEDVAWMSGARQHVDHRWLVVARRGAEGQRRSLNLDGVLRGLADGVSESSTLL